MWRHFLIFLILVTTIGLTLHILGPARLYLALQANGVPTSGVIVDVKCFTGHSNINFFYNFSVQDNTYKGSRFISGKCSNYKRGNSIPVIYLRSDPSQNISGDLDLASAYIDDVYNTAMKSIILSILTIGCLRRIVDHYNNWVSQNTKR
jgi:hypothetical protein